MELPDVAGWAVKLNCEKLLNQSFNINIRINNSNIYLIAWYYTFEEIF